MLLGPIDMVNFIKVRPLTPNRFFRVLCRATLRNSCDHSEVCYFVSVVLMALECLGSNPALSI